MQFFADLHTHTIVSGHAYSTIKDYIDEAKEKGILAIAFTEHGPALPGACDPFYYINFAIIPRVVEGITLYMGIELSIIDYDGNVDVDEHILSQMDIVIASFHRPVLAPGTEKENTHAVIKALENPFIDIIGHLGDPRFPVNTDEVAKVAAINNKFIEVNNSSLVPGSFRDGGRDFLKELLVSCIKHNTSISLGSDAHFYKALGDFTYTKKVLDEVSFPLDLIINTDMEMLNKRFARHERLV